MPQWVSQEMVTSPSHVPHTTLGERLRQNLESLCDWWRHLWSSFSLEENHGDYIFSCVCDLPVIGGATFVGIL